MLAPFVVVLLILAAVLVLLFQGAALVLAAAMRSLGPAAPPMPTGNPRVSVIIAARNEESDLGQCLDALLAQEFAPCEILVVDGGSTDRSREIVRARAPRVQLVEEPPLPSGWVGKSWACQIGAEHATGEYLLFSDADMRYHPRTLGVAIAWAQAEHAELVSLAPRIEMVAFWEKVVLPFYTQMVLTYFRASRVNRDRSRSAMANGQFLLVRRSAYDVVGGHAAVRGVLPEDVRLAQLFRSAGFRLRIGWAPDLVTTRMYRDRHEMFEGLLKNIHGVRFSVWRQAGFAAALVGFFWLPLLLLPFGWITGSVWLVGVGAFLWFALFVKHAVFTRAVRGEAVYGLLFPLAVGFYLRVLASSLAHGLRHRPVTWKGRSYSLKE